MGSIAVSFIVQIAWRCVCGNNEPHRTNLFYLCAHILFETDFLLFNFFFHLIPYPGEYEKHHQRCYNFAILQPHQTTTPPLSPLAAHLLTY